MIIKKVAVGNEQEAFVESRFRPGINVISSDDNNKGKTIIIQSMMYALGNEPTFPTSFNYKDYYHYCEFVVAEKQFQVCRRGDSYIVRHDSILMIFDNTSELKRYWDKRIFSLPKIIKNQMLRIVDPVLFFQLFFAGQDKKDTSNISHSGYYTKADFENMIFDICNTSGVSLSKESRDRIVDDIRKLKEEKQVLLKQHKILKSTKTPITFLSTTSDRIAFDKKIDEMVKCQSRITELRKSRNTAATRKARWESTIKELNSLNRTMGYGELHCMDCNSRNIAFSSSRKGEYSFDVSSVDMRNEIITSIREKILAYDEELEKLGVQISEVQDVLQDIMKDESVSLESIVVYKNEIFKASDAEQRISEIDGRLEELETNLALHSKKAEANKHQQISILQEIIKKTNEVCKFIDPQSNLSVDSLFTKRHETYSGSEATIFHVARLLAIQSVINHNYPIIIDSFRAEDLSTDKEASVFLLFKKIENQIIVTTTLKTEELGKYDHVDQLNHIDYSKNTPSKILCSEHVNILKELLEELSINMQLQYSTQ